MIIQFIDKEKEKCSFLKTKMISKINQLKNQYAFLLFRFSSMIILPHPNPLKSNSHTKNYQCVISRNTFPIPISGSSTPTVHNTSRMTLSISKIKLSSMPPKAKTSTPAAASANTSSNKSSERAASVKSI